MHSGQCTVWLSTIPRSTLPAKLNKVVGKCVTTESFRLEDLIKYKDLKGLKNFTMKPSGVKINLPWNSLIKIIIHAIYFLNDCDVTKAPFDSLNTRKSRKESTDTEATEDDTNAAHVNNDNQEGENLRDTISANDVFAEVINEPLHVEHEPASVEPAKKAPRLSSHDMFGPDSPPAPPENILTPLFDISTNSGDTKPKTVRLQILSIVGIDKFGFIGNHTFSFLIFLNFNKTFSKISLCLMEFSGPISRLLKVAKNTSCK